MRLFIALSCGFGGFALSAADLKPDATTEIPASSKREVVIKLDKSRISDPKTRVPQADLPEGFEIVTVAGAPLVTHPIMGCLDDRGRLFVGDAIGVNWNKKQLEANPPNRILMLEDTDRRRQLRQEHRLRGQDDLPAGRLLARTARSTSARRRASGNSPTPTTTAWPTSAR